MPDTSTSRATGRRHNDIALTVSLVLAGLVAILILVGSIFYSSDQKGVYVTANQRARSRRQLAIPKLLRLRPLTMGVGFGRRSFLCEVARKLQRAAQWLCYSMST